MRKPPPYERAHQIGYVRRIRGFAARCLAAASLCTGLLAHLPIASAQEAHGLGEAIGRIFEGANLKNSPPPPADFVVNSRQRTDSLDYSPYAAQGAATEAKKKTAKDFDAIGAELSRAGAINRARAAGVARPDNAGAPAARKKSAGSVGRDNKRLD